MPLLSRADHRPPVRCLVAARRAVSAQGRFNSSDHRTQSRAALTRWQCSKCRASTSGRSDRRPSMMFRVSSTPWLTPTSWSSSSRALFRIQTKRIGTQSILPFGLFYSHFGRSWGTSRVSGDFVAQSWFSVAKQSPARGGAKTEKT